MARTAIGRLGEAKELDKLADSLKTRDPASSRAIQEKANALRRSAIKQLGRKPKKKSRGDMTLRPGSVNGANVTPVPIKID